MRSVEKTIDNLLSTFRISDIERLCPSVSRDMIRVILNRLRKEDHLSCKGTGLGPFGRNVVITKNKDIIEGWKISMLSANIILLRNSTEFRE